MEKMKRLSFSTLFAILFASLLITSCGDDNTDVKSVYIGDYTIKEAKLAETLQINIVYGEDTMDVPIPVGQDFTEMIQSALLNSIPDCDPEDSYIELHEDYSMHMSCAASDFTLNAGTWAEQSNGTVLVLNFNSSAIPSAPNGFSLTATDVSLENGIMSSTVTIPIPYDVMKQAIDSSGQAILTEDNDDPFMLTLTLKFNKVN